MNNSKIEETILDIYAENFTRIDYGINDLIITEALAVATADCKTKKEYFRTLSALNLLNSAIKDSRWKNSLSYGFIKGQAGKLFDNLIANPISGVNVYYNSREDAVFFKIDGVIFSFHRIKLTDRMLSFVRSQNNVPIVWEGIRLQKIPVELFDISSAA